MPTTKTKRPALKAVPPTQSKPRKPKVLVFGAPGVGKTWASLDFPNVYYIDVEGGAKEPEYIAKLEQAKAGYFGPEHGSTVFEEVNDQILALMTSDHDYKTIVIDSMTELFNGRIFDEAEGLERANKKNEFGADKKLALKPMRRFIRLIDRLDMNVVLICHEKSKWGEIQGQKEQIGFTFDCWDTLGHNLDLTIRVWKAGGSRYGKPTKSRIKSFPEEERFEWSFAEFAKRWGIDAITRDTETVTLVTEENLAEIQRLFDALNYPEEKKVKLLKHFKADEFSEITDKQATDLIAKIKDL